MKTIKTKIWLLPAEKAIIGSLIHNLKSGDNTFLFTCTTDTCCFNVNSVHKDSWKPYHMYFTVEQDEKIELTTIKVDDFYIDPYDKKIRQALSSIPTYSEFKHAQKIIASTDTALNLPKPSDIFINDYIEKYNRNYIFDICYVEFEQNPKKQKLFDFALEVLCIVDNLGDPECEHCKGHGCLDDGNEFGCIMIRCPHCYPDKLCLDNNIIKTKEIKDSVKIGDELYSIMQRYLDYCQQYGNADPADWIRDDL